MGAGHSHTAGKNENALWISLALTTTILVAELIGGVVTGSLALISDAAHMFTDAAALAIALAAIRIAKRPLTLYAVLDTIVWKYWLPHLMP